MCSTFGFNYFTVMQKRREGKDAYVLMMAACDTSLRVWVNVRNLKDRQRWACGWLEKAERAADMQQGRECRTCAGTGLVECPLCRLQAGEVVSV